MIRINCNGHEYRDADGILWSEDRFFTGPVPDDELYVQPTDGAAEAIYRRQRGFPVHLRTPAGYRLPLPDGQYQVTLHFMEVFHTVHHTSAAWRRNFDIYLEGELRVRGYEVSDAGFATVDAKTFEVSVNDGVLDIEFVSRVVIPVISAIEVERR